MRTGIMVSFLTLSLLSLCAGGFAQKQLKLIPNPREVEFTQGETLLSREWIICLENGDQEDASAAQALAEEAKMLFGWDWNMAQNIPDKNFILLKKYNIEGNEPELFKEQGYILTIDSRSIVIEGADSTGRFYGIQTLRQILRNAQDRSIPQLRIKDYPALKWRGISDDISRGQVSQVDDFKDIVRQLAFYKINLYQPYMEDMFRFETDPDIGKDRGAVTKKEMAALVEEGKKNHVLITPVFECLGHQDRLLSLPENRKYAERQDPEKEPWSFSPVNEEAFQFVTQLIDEICAVVPSPFFHIGGDESFDVGEGTSKEQVKKDGIGKVHADYFSRLNRYIRDKHNRRMMLYADMILGHPEAMEYMDKDSIMIDWHYDPDYNFESVRKLKDAGFKSIITSPGIWSWACYHPNLSAAFKNVSKAADAAKKENLMGCITSSWGDHGAENLRVNNWPGYAFSGAAEWEADTPNEERFLRRFVALHLGNDIQELADTIKLLGSDKYFSASQAFSLLHKTLKIKQNDPEYSGKLSSMKQSMEAVRKVLTAQKQKVKFYRDYMDNLDDVARRNMYLADRDTTLDRIAKLLGDKPSGDLPREKQEQILKDLIQTRDTLIEITGAYPRYWLARNKYPKLDFNQARLQGQIAQIQEFITLAKRGELTIEKPPWGVWFWYPDNDPTTETGKGTRYFVRMFNLEKKPVSATLKCWADDKATFYMNGERIMRVNFHDQPRIKTFTSPLKQGENILAVEGYNSIGAAAVLLEMEMTFEDKTILQLTGDDEWLSTQDTVVDWNKIKPTNGNWQKVKLLGKGLIKPWDYIDW